MTRVDDFDAFYHATRTSLLHQTYALTGDADRAASAVEHAFAHTWSQWRKVRHLDDPAGWVRNEAWRVAGSQLPRRRPRRTARRRFSGDPADSAHTHDLETLREMSDGQRRAVVLHYLAALPIDRIAREIGISESTASSLLVKGEQKWAAERTSIAAALANIGSDVDNVTLTRAPSLRRAGEKRHRQQTLVGVVTAAALLVGGGLLVVNDSPAPMQPAAVADDRAGAEPPSVSPTPVPEASEPEPFLLDQSALLNADAMSRLTSPRREWTVPSTTDGTGGDPIYAPCQREPFADPDGNQSLLRRYETAGAGDRLSAVQVIEESRNARQGALGFETMQGWYARCEEDGVQLLRTLRVRGLGDEAVAFRLHQSRSDTEITVGIVRSGPITTAVVASRHGQAVPPPRVLDRAAVSVDRVCREVGGGCGTEARINEVPPLPTEEFPGFLASFDLPGVAGVKAPWVGTDPRRTTDNAVATPCDRARFGRAQDPRTRVFVLPTAKKLPRRFGLSETVATFATRAKARKFVNEAEASARSCPDRELSAAVPNSKPLPDGLHGQVWRFEFEVNEASSVFYRVGLVRVGSRVALLSMSPTEQHDVTLPEFTGLVVRASHRLSDAD